ncbi:MAG: 4a-hydroxytetrahydrobiopterin dehydratase [Schleiferiaceae bacterium]|jgi:4a-hydroxytetrahydrobiopterin dehydratase|nr:4a-hydroxytetrahydrobiopterin dehydratase [Schleiferiaceae bacterium]
MKRLSEEGIKMRLEFLSKWSLKDGKLHRDVVFKDFKQALSAMVQIGFLAEELNHHPEWKNVYNRLAIDLTTHDAGGITVLDFDLAKSIEDLIETYGAH